MWVRITYDFNWSTSEGVYKVQDDNEACYLIKGRWVHKDWCIPIRAPLWWRIWNRFCEMWA